MPSPRQRSPRHVSGYLRDNALRKQLEERVKETARTRQAAEDGLRAAQDMIDQARRVDATVTEAEKALAAAGRAMGAKDYTVAVDKAHEAREPGARNGPRGPHLRAGEGDPRRGGPDAVCRGARRGHDQGFEPDRAGPGRHHQSRLREGEERAEPEPRGIGESPPAIARGERGGFLAHRPGGEGDGRRPDGRARPVREGRGRDPQRSIPGSGSAREARVPDGPADAVSAGRRSP